MALATTFLSSANSFLSSSSSSSSSSSLFFRQKNNAMRQVSICRAFSESPSPSPSSPILTKRSLSISFITSFVFSLASRSNSSANAAILEADDDEELLERVKRDRKKRIERQGFISSSNKETGYLQDLVYKLSKVGQAIENNDLSTAGSVLGGSTNTDWVQKANIAFSKVNMVNIVLSFKLLSTCDCFCVICPQLSSSTEEKKQVDTFNSSLSSLISSVTGKDIESSKLAFVSSATAFEKWTTLTGLFGQLKGL
ncbi:thylakoid lumenal 16.5 kDa protein, chloroplastic isoform X1 [Manihot esculenta]|uniref:thylakoid lumenal 16.5 kDa protein, chloroplastic isoform X1 n=1 Tax=Manihot esculenta TaxID=3983 RepID=UPI000B5D5E61|nr:thylakoid lumenal 16.5 kDa protein, chloroplastic isoform X1 [Manihot esculenta]